MIPERFIAIDPGKTTGLCVFTTQILTFTAIRKIFLYSWLKRFYLGDADADTHIFIEMYDIDANTHKKTRQYDAMDIIGAVDFVSAMNEGVVAHKQSRTVKSNYPNDWFMETFDSPSPVFLRCANDHEQDALRHMTYGIGTYGDQHLWDMYCAALQAA